MDSRWTAHGDELAGPGPNDPINIKQQHELGGHHSCHGGHNHLVNAELLHNPWIINAWFIVWHVSSKYFISKSR